ncbi:MAG: plasmid segregation protein ParM [Petrotoga sp.]|nr:plasmid segregation protein ParM [Petrotoga sp.]
MEMEGREKEIVVVDGGFGWVKWLYGDKQGKFRSCYKKLGDNWIFGEKALLETGSRYLRTVDELVEMYPAIIREVERRAGVQERNICCVGLPLSVFEGNGFEEYATVLDMRLKRLGYQDVYVLPQGLGGIKWFLKNRTDFEGNILGVDIGFNTVIVVLYSVKEREILIAKTYYKKGVYDLVVSLLLPRIRKFVGERTLTPIELNYLMEHRKLQIGFDVIDLSPEVEESVNEYVEDLLKFIVNDIKASVGVVPFEVVVFMGGGANWLRDKVEAKKVEVVFLDEYANAYGFREKVKEILLERENEGLSS